MYNHNLEVKTGDSYDIIWLFKKEKVLCDGVHLFVVQCTWGMKLLYIVVSWNVFNYCGKAIFGSSKVPGLKEEENEILQGNSP